MNKMYLTTTDNYETAWAELNTHLDICKQSQDSLSAALLELETHQKQAGFIKDDLKDVTRVNYVHPEHPFCYLHVQYNPKRALRFNGSGIKLPPEGAPSVNNGCFLCRENIQWQQQGREMGYAIEVMDSHYYVWMNPFPLLPCHVVVTAREHISQEWDLHPAGTLSLELLIGDLVALAKQLPGFIGFYNGINAGASIPGHMHYQFCMRPEENIHFPLEQAERDYTEFGHTGIVRGYPLAVAVWQGSPAEVVGHAVDWVRYWAAHNAMHIEHLTANFIATADPETGEVSLYFAPRDRNRSKSGRMSGLVGGLEVMGELVFSSDGERAAMDEDRINCRELMKIYEDIYTPFFIDSSTRLRKES